MNEKNDLHADTCRFVKNIIKLYYFALIRVT